MKVVFHDLDWKNNLKLAGKVFILKLKLRKKLFDWWVNQKAKKLQNMWKGKRGKELKVVFHDLDWKYNLNFIVKVVLLMIN